MEVGEGSEVGGSGGRGGGGGHLREGVVGDNHDCVSVGDPHVAHVAVGLQQLLVALVGQAVRLHTGGVLHQLVRWHTLKGDLR